MSRKNINPAFVKRTLEDITKIRRSRLYIPGNNPAMIRNAPLFGADEVIFDLEDGVAVNQKDAARILVRNALKELNFNNTEVTVRINSFDTKFFYDDINEIVPAKPYAIVLPKAEDEKQVMEICDAIAIIEDKSDLPIGAIKLMPIIESAWGVLRAEGIARASDRIIGISPGGEDLTADLGAERTDEGDELLYIRSRLVLAARANGVQVYDTIYPNVRDLEGLYKQTEKIVQMGFDGKACIHPSQIEPIHKAFSPTAEQLERAERIVEAYRIAQKEGIGVICVDNRMIDVPVVKRSERILKRAEAAKKRW
ncbi:MAG: HpcH/HpaI aldolase/citrate lyase family protein [Candidatus Heimdallarchaeota archaeon]|nr:HpcH/HpaI aldolase/citrate lyase family protein [Candidatus Heimdallarchaeota archaeon]